MGTEIKKTEQQKVIGIGRIDILCETHSGDYIVVEIKRHGASNREVIGQIASYIGWVKMNLVSPQNEVKGLIIVSTKDEKLEYAVSAISGLEVKSFKIGLE